MTMLHLAVQEQVGEEQVAQDQIAQEETAPSGSSRTGSQPRPAAPRPHTERMGLFATIRALRPNPITAFPAQAYQVPILEGGRLRKLVLVNEPAEIDHAMAGNAASS